MKSTQNMLNEHADSLDAMVRQYAAAITRESSPEGRQAIYDLAHDAGVDPDDFDVYESLQEIPYAVTDERGKPFSLLLAGGGPTFEVVAEGDDHARLEGYWGSDRATRDGKHYDTFLDYFIER